MTISIKSLFAFGILLAIAHVADAANCSSYPYPYILTTGTTADANQVMADFNVIMNCANNALVQGDFGTFTSGVLTGSTTNSGTIIGGNIELLTLFVGGTGPIDSGDVFEVKETNSDGDVRAAVSNAAAANASTATFMISASTGNIFMQEQLNNNSGAPTFSMVAGSSLTGGVDIDAAAAALTLKANTAIIFDGPYANTNYERLTPTTGFSISIGSYDKVILVPAGTLASGTFIFPSNPVDGQTLRVFTTQTISSITLSASAGQTISNPLSAFGPYQHFAYLYVASNKTWYPLND